MVFEPGADPADEVELANLAGLEHVVPFHRTRLLPRVALLVLRLGGIQILGSNS